MPREISVFSNLLSAVTLSVMLMLVGYQACPVYDSVLLKTSSAVVLRMAGGFFSALLFCEIFGIIDVTRQVCLLTSGMPAAVNSYILAKRYGADFSFAASAISIGLIASLIFIPFILWLM